MIRNRKGVTLVELLIVLALISVVSIIAFSFYFFGVRTFAKGESQSQAQYDIRMASTFVTREVRNAVSFQLVPIPTTYASGFEYLYIKNNQLIHYNGTAITKTDGIITSHSFTLTSVTDSNNKPRNILKISLGATVDNQNYATDTEVVLNNIKTLPASSDVAIKYKKP
jgi:prepilin-type N-terminal cleavage/methylation domain-containing protein